MEKLLHIYHRVTNADICEKVGDKLEKVLKYFKGCYERGLREHNPLTGKEHPKALISGFAGTSTAGIFADFARSQNSQTEVFAIDIGEIPVRAISEKDPCIHASVADARKTPFREKTFDWIESDLLWNFLPIDDVRKVISEWVRILTDDGVATTRVGVSPKALKRFLNWLHIPTSIVHTREDIEKVLKVEHVRCDVREKFAGMMLDLSIRKSDWQTEARSVGIRFEDGGVSEFATDTRKELMRDYARHHYGMDTWELTDPKVVIVHATAINTYAGTREVYEGERLPSAREDISSAGEVNVSAHFVIDRDGTIYQMAPVNFMCRHAIGYNYTAFGIENVLTEEELMTDEQVRANAWLIAKLRREFPSIVHVIPHKGYAEGSQVGLVRNVSGLYDPVDNPRQDPYGDDFERIGEQIFT